MISGVCGGLGQYLGVDPTIVRLFFVLLVLGDEVGILVYLLLWIILPVEGDERAGSFDETVRSGSEEIVEHAREMGDDLRQMVRSPNRQVNLIVGGALLILGFVFLIDNLPLPWLNWLNYDVIWPLLLILGGVALLTRHLRGE